MKKVYLVEETEKIKRIESQVYNELFDLLKLKKPKAKTLVEDPLLFELCDLLVLFRSGHFRIQHVMADTPNFYLLEVFEEQAKRPFKNHPAKNLIID